MAAGIDPKRLNARLRYRLQRIASELRNAGVECYYREYQVTDPSGNFVVEYRVLRASNGEVAALPRVRFADGTPTHEYLEFARGKALVVAKFGRVNV